ncbi:hypothetical protein [Kribbella sp. NPDC048915]|uniref:hypothetical protein n=1 Tax=Kribbella sp. NPDC048915 TaxID=3155148 RepID=UPI00340A0526
MPLHPASQHGLPLAAAALVACALTGCEPTDPPGGGSKGRPITSQSGATVKITTSKKTCWSGQIGTTTRKGCGSATIQLKSSKGTYTVNIHKTTGADGLTVALVVNGKRVNSTHSNSSSTVAITHTSN